MDAHKLTICTNPAQEAFDRTEAAYAAQRARRIAANDAQSGTKFSDKLDSVPARTWFATSR
jgi:hypothetical protein